MRKKVLALLTAVALIAAMIPSMAFAETSAAKSDDIVILATSDVHCAVDQNIGYAGLAAYKKAMEEKYNNVILVDAGDAIQGDAIGTLSNGTYLRDIMNKVGYDVVVPGNHEFDYGMDQFLNEIAAKMNVKYISANFMKEGKLVFDSYKMIDCGGKKVAFVGVCTPETLVKSTPAYFQDKDGNYIYSFAQGDNGKELYKAVQAGIDDAKKAGADYVIAVGHLGDDSASTPWTSTEVIANTTGLNAFIDGHAHMTFTKPVKDKAGKAVQVVSTGTKLENIGKVVISSKGVVSVANVTKEEAAAKDADVEKFVEEIKAKYETVIKQVVAKSDVDLRTHSEDGETRLVRSQETNLGDLCADAYKSVLGTDIAFINGGGVRAEIKKGDVTYGDIIAVHPFGNMACSIEATGQEILDALEFGSRFVGEGENGGFLQVAGLTYEINPFIKSTVVVNEAGEFVKVAGARRVFNVKVNGAAIDPAKKYTLGSHNYMLKQGGDGYVMFKGNKVLRDEVKIDNQVLIDYIQKDLNGRVGQEYAQPQGRIKIAKADEVISPIVQKLEVAEYDCKVKAKSTKSYVKLTWNACTAQNVKYRVYRSAKTATNFKKIYSTSNTSFVTRNLKPGVKYYFKVRPVKVIDGKLYFGHYSNLVSGRRTA